MNLKLDRLEPRDCPAVTVVQQGQFVFVTGDRADDAVAARDLGDNRIEVAVGRDAWVFGDTCWLRIDLGGGADAFTFTYTDRPSSFLDVGVNLGGGNDQALFQHKRSEDIPPEPQRPTEYKFDVRGEAGRDLLNFRHAVVPSQELNFRADLGAGDDSLTMTNAPGAARGPAGALGVEVEGGPGNDDMRVDVGGLNSVAPVDLNMLSVAVGGGVGSDAVELNFLNFRTRALTQTVDMGDGDDEIEFFSIDSQFGTSLHKVGLGAGHDRATLTMDGVTHKNDFAFDLLGDVGDDKVDLSIHKSTVEGGGRLLVNTGGGRDRLTTVLDELSHNYEPLPMVLMTGDGDDFLAAELNDVGHNYEAGVDFLLGDGNDVGVVMASHKLPPPLNLRVEQGTGDDVLLLTAAVEVPDVQLDPGEPQPGLNFVALGGAGNDVTLLNVAVAYDGRSNTPTPFRVNVVADGGAGRDVVAVQGAYRGGDLPAGTVTVVANGGAGDDFLILLWPDAPRVGLRAVANGGDGLDAAIVTPNVQVFDVEL